jgi:integrase
MPRKKQGVTLHGPYRHRDRWRVLRRAPGDPDKWVSFDTEVEANTFLTEARRRLEGWRVSEAITAYVASMKRRDCAKESLTFARNRLRSLARDQDELLASITPARARVLLDRVEGSVATRRETLKLARRWWAWLVGEGWARGAPWDGLQVLGVRGRGKAQLTGQEAARLAAWCIAAVPTKPRKLGVLLALMMGLRRNEIVHLCGRDIDMAGTVLWVRGTKTANAMRRLEVPAILAPLLLDLAEKVGPGGHLFGHTAKSWMREHIHGACDAAGVPRVSPHGLRGTFATLATSAGAAAHAVAEALGHGTDTAIAERHYIQAGASQAAAAARVLTVIAGGKGG